MDPRRLREALRKEGIFVHESDPILEIGAICEMAVSKATKDIEEVASSLAKNSENTARAAADQMSVAAAQNREAIKQSAEQVVKAAAEWCAADMKRSAAAAADEIACRLREPVERAENAAKLSVQAAWIAGCSASFVVIWIVGRTIGYAIPLTWKFW